MTETSNGRQTDETALVDTVLDVMFYAPVGLLLSLTEEVPRLAAKGRVQLSTAKVVGRLAVTHGRKKLERRIEQFAGAPPATPTHLAARAPSGPTKVPSAAPTARPAPGPVRASASAPSTVTAPKAGLTTPIDQHTVRETLGAPADPSGGNGKSATSGRVELLAIPGYDSLSASQVVQRLAGLSPAELESVRAYEAAGRGRRTILTKVGQLQGS